MLLIGADFHSDQKERKLQLKISKSNQETGSLSEPPALPYTHKHLLKAAQMIEPGILCTCRKRIVVTAPMDPISRKDLPPTPETKKLLHSLPLQVPGDRPFRYPILNSQCDSLQDYETSPPPKTEPKLLDPHPTQKQI